MKVEFSGERSSYLVFKTSKIEIMSMFELGGVNFSKIRLNLD